MKKAKFFIRKNQEGEKKYLFCVLTDFLEGYKKTEAEEKKRKENDLKEYFQLFDDDGILYYSGYLNSEVLEEFGTDEFEVLGWGEYFAGCTEMKLRNKDGKMETL